jgi:hypothetical protein
MSRNDQGHNYGLNCLTLNYSLDYRINDEYVLQYNKMGYETGLN